jgi:hypothetical protein
MAAPRKAATPAGIPHSWELDTWPASVWPHDTGRAQWVCRAYRKDLIAAGALSRVGYRVVILGAGYSRWLESRSAKVVEYRSNNPSIGAPRQTTAHGGAA